MIEERIRALTIVFHMNKAALLWERAFGSLFYLLSVLHLAFTHVLRINLSTKYENICNGIL